MARAFVERLRKQTESVRQAIAAGEKPELLEPKARRILPCIHLGALVKRAQCICPRKDTRRCDEGHGDVRQAFECEACADYEADGEAAESSGS
jgi:hypothetical protein